MLELDMFSLPVELHRSMEDSSFTTDDELCFKLELYKIVNRDKMIEILTEEYPHLNIQQVSSYESGSWDTDSQVMAQKLLEEHDVLVKYENTNQAIIYASATKDIHETMLSISLSNVKQVDFVYVTPYNLFELKGIKYSEWDYWLMFRRILYEALEQHATDVHFDVKHVNLEPVYTVEMRVDNIMEDCALFAFDAEMNSSIIHTLIEAKTDANAQDLGSEEGVSTASYGIFGDTDVSVRVSANKVIKGFKCVCRIQTYSTVSLKMGELGFDQRVVNDLEKLSSKIGGLTLITGSIRTGKNTTAFAIGNEMVLDRSRKIVDYSSPVEVLMPFSQIDYMSSISYLTNLVRQTKKQDVNVVFVNEIPNSEVAQAMSDLVTSSVNVITTTHLNRIWNLPYKLVDFFGDSYRNVISQINGCVNQRMFNVQCPHCKRETITSSLSQPELFGHRGEDYIQLLKQYDVEILWINDGCDECKDGRLKGKIQPYVEHLVFTDEIKSNLLRFSEPFKMEEFLKRCVYEYKQHLEYYLCNAIKKGKLHVTSLDSIL